jgi:hypothetical protein
MLVILIGFGVLVTPEKGLLPSGAFNRVCGPETAVLKGALRAFDASFLQVALQYRCSW